MASRTEKPLSEVIEERRDTPSFDGAPIPDADLKEILEAGLKMPSGFNLQPWRLVVVRTPELQRKLRAACFNQPNVEEASVVIVACGDKDSWRSDMDEMIRMGRESGMTENYAESARSVIPEFMSSHPNLSAWLNRHVMIAFTAMMLMAETLGYDTSSTEGYDPEKVCQILNLPISYEVIALLGIGHLRGLDKYNGGRFSMQRTVFEGEYGKPIKL
jgi:nitroreductase